MKRWYILVTMLVVGTACGSHHNNTNGGSYVPPFSVPGPTTNDPPPTFNVQEIVDKIKSQSRPFKEAQDSSAALSSSTTGNNEFKAANDYLVAVINNTDRVWSRW